MTKAKITRRDGYKCAPRGATVETFAFGQIVTGKVAQWALADHAACAMFDPREETAVAPPPETKAKRGRPRKAVE
jgi:hypothetical protein